MVIEFSVVLLRCVVTLEVEVIVRCEVAVVASVVARHTYAEIVMHTTIYVKHYC